MFQQIDDFSSCDYYQEEQELLKGLFQNKCTYSLAQIKGVMACGHLTFRQLLNRYEEHLTGWLDDESQDILKALRDGAYLQQVWDWINDKDQYKQWVHIYLENRKKLVEIAKYYLCHNDYNYDLRNSALEALNELYLAQTQPGEPSDLDLDPYTGIHDDKEIMIKVSPEIDGDPSYDRLYFEDEDDLFDDRGITSSPIQQSNEFELKPTDYYSLKISDVGKRIGNIRQEAIKYRKENHIQRRDWKLLKLRRKPSYLDEAGVQNILKSLHKDELAEIVKGLEELSHSGEPAQDLLLMLVDGTYIDFLAPLVKLQENGLSTPNLHVFGQYYGNEVLDHAEHLQDPSGWREADEVYYFNLLKDYTAPILYDESKIETSSLFNNVVLEHILSSRDVSNAYKQAYHACKMAQSPEGEAAYRRAIAEGKSFGQAMQAFYNTAYQLNHIERPRDRVISVHPDKMVVLTGASQYSQQREINWRIASLKARNAELYVPAEAPLALKQQIFSAAKSLRWSMKAMESLRE